MKTRPTQKRPETRPPGSRLTASFPPSTLNTTIRGANVSTGAPILWRAWEAHQPSTRRKAPMGGKTPEKNRQKPPLLITFHVSRITHHASRIPPPTPSGHPPAETVRKMDSLPLTHGLPHSNTLSSPNLRTNEKKRKKMHSDFPDSQLLTTRLQKIFTSHGPNRFLASLLY